MIYISPDNEYPTFYGEIQLQNPGWKFGDPLPEGWQEVVETDPPSVSENQKAYEEFPVEIDGVMTQKWAIRDMTDEEIAARNAPETLKTKLSTLEFNEYEKDVLRNGVFL